MTKEDQQKLVSERDHIVIHKITDTVITKHRDGTEVYAVKIIRQPLVRCEDCKHRYMDADLQVWTCTYGLMIKPNGFCNYGERKESE